MSVTLTTRDLLTSRAVVIAPKFALRTDPRTPSVSVEQKSTAALLQVRKIHLIPFFHFKALD